ncbi:alpha/beta fold hydrolase [Glaciecola petra]|uniref:Alpha/beta hydrolase n=1 Tax=Glaciecola petra TaxID=3075602 RepID=A0ABU2ZM94_9ALTE|nr:alpha/beta hydrolase [Aestuariibacter sp. P117]MDT0593746.1 alpha/beta hydrolase [Aestuariibacter sp. P117]
MRSLFKLLAICTMFGTLVLGVGVSAAPKYSLEPIRFAQLNDVRLAFKDSAHGDVVVIFDAGFGTDQETWQLVINALPASIRTITYSRAGIGKSSAVSKPRAILNHLEDLRALKAYLDINQPFIYVTHSYSGLIASEYAEAFPKELKGMVMVEPATLSQRHQFKAIDAQFIKREDIMLLQYMPEHLVADYKLLIEQMDNACKHTRALPKNIPVHVITAGQVSNEPFAFNETEQGKALWIKQHSELISNQERQVHHIVDSPDHNLHKTHPELVANSILALVNSRRDK